MSRAKASLPRRSCHALLPRYRATPGCGQSLLRLAGAGLSYEEARNLRTPRNHACPSFACTASPSPWTATAPVPIRVSTTRSASAARRCTSGCSRPARSSSMSGKDGGRPASTTTSRRAASTTSARGSWAATCSARSAGPWPDDTWKGWWGDNPAYHCPVFVLTHHARATDRDGWRHDLPLRHRRHRGCAATRHGSRQWQGRPRSVAAPPRSGNT